MAKEYDRYSHWKFHFCLVKEKVDFLEPFFWSRREMFSLDTWDMRTWPV